MLLTLHHLLLEEFYLINFDFLCSKVFITEILYVFFSSLFSHLPSISNALHIKNRLTLCVVLTYGVENFNTFLIMPRFF